MAERFVYGFAASTDALWALVGSHLDPTELLRDVDPEFEDFDEELSDEGYDVTMVDCARHVLTGNLDKGLAYPYSRLVEPMIGCVAEPLGMVHMAVTYYLPNNSFDRWSPVLKKLRLTTLARRWGKSNFPFPWPQGHRPAKWPAVTAISPSDLAEVSAELASDWRARLAALPNKILADSHFDPDESREELAEGLTKLTNWAARAAGPWKSTKRCLAPSANSLILIMDGGQ